MTMLKRTQQFKFCAIREQSILDLYKQWRSGHLEFSLGGSPWVKEQQSSLIESVMIHLPLPVFVIGEDGVVIDGQKRLLTLFAFYEGVFTLTCLQIIPELNEQAFAAMDPKMQNRFESTALVCCILPRGTTDSVKHALFDKLNVSVTSVRL